MSDKFAQLKENLKAIVKANPNLPIDGIVTKISGETCTVKLNDGFEISDIRLKVTSVGSNSLLMIPEIGSTILMISTDGTIGNLTVIKMDKASEIFLHTTTGAYIKVSKNGITVEAINKPIRVISGNSSVAITDNGVDIISDKQISLNGGFEALYNKVPGMPITDVSQIGVSQKVKIG